MKLRFFGQVKQFRGTRRTRGKKNNKKCIKPDLKRGVYFPLMNHHMFLKSSWSSVNNPEEMIPVFLCPTLPPETNKSSWKMGGWKMKFLFKSNAKTPSDSKKHCFCGESVPLNYQKYGPPLFFLHQPWFCLLQRETKKKKNKREFPTENHQWEIPFCRFLGAPNPRQSELSQP